MSETGYIGRYNWWVGGAAALWAIVAFVQMWLPISLRRYNGGPIDSMVAERQSEDGEKAVPDAAPGIKRLRERGTSYS
jgi:hypothetical protein